MALRTQINVPKVWRSEWFRIVLFVVCSIASVVVSIKVPATVIKGELFKIAGKQYLLTLPLATLLPAGLLVNMLWRIYNVRYTIDKRGVRSRIGILALSQRITDVRFEDIRSVEIEQSLLERFLDTGAIKVATAATEGIEIQFRGIGSPRSVQELVLIEQERRKDRERATREKQIAQQLAASA